MGERKITDTVPAPAWADATAKRQVLDWFIRCGRHDLPWRLTRNPWHITVAEFMLQQTQVSRVLGFYHPFLDAFPTPQACAAAPLSAVLITWQGLGFPRRAKYLHELSRIVCEHHNGQIPRDMVDLRALPGVGVYTAAAIRCFAFEEAEPIVDTNVGRILARLSGCRMSTSQVRAAAAEFLDREHPWQWNQAVFDVGATVCHKRVPACERCPLAGRCTWFLEGSPLPDPAVGSAGVARPQATFQGSDRQMRGQVMKLLGGGAVRADELSALLAHDDASKIRRVVAGLVRDGLIMQEADVLSLPGNGAH